MALARRRSSVGGAALAAAVFERRRSSNSGQSAGDIQGGGEASTAGDDVGSDLNSTTLTASEWQFLVTSVRVQKIEQGTELVRGGQSDSGSRSGAPRRLYQIAGGKVKAVRINMKARRQVSFHVIWEGLFYTFYLVERSN